MAVTNKMIIMDACALYDIQEPVETYAGWQRAGYQVKKGSKALFQTSIWKPCKSKGKQTEEAETSGSTDSTEKKSSYRKMMMVKASFFGLSQVEKIAETASALNTYS